jgi:hypothetical protein
VEESPLSRAQMHMIGLHRYAPLPTEDSRRGKGQKIGIEVPCYSRRVSSMRNLSLSLPPPLLHCVLHFRASSCSCHFVPYTLSNPSRSLQLFEPTRNNHSHLHTVALRLVLIARRVHHLNNTRNTPLQHFHHASLFLLGRSCSLVHGTCICSNTLLV